MTLADNIARGESLPISEKYTWSEYLDSVIRHINGSLSDEEEERVYESYQADYSVHETISQLDLI